MKKYIYLLVAFMTVTGATAQNQNESVADRIKQTYEKQQKAFEEANSEVTAKMKELFAAYNTAKNNETRDSLSKVSAQYYPKLQAAMDEYMKVNPSTILTASFIAPRSSQMGDTELAEAYAKLCDDAKQSEYGQAIKKDIDAREALKPGKPAPLIAKNDIDGKPFSLADLKGNVVLLDFWASWCGPCRKGNPHMLSLYEKRYDKGLRMVFVGDNDPSVGELRKAIEKDGLNKPGITHLLRGLKVKKNEKGETIGYDRSEDVSDIYGVHYLPTKFIIDREGKMVGKFDNEKLDAKLKDLFGE